MRKKARVIQTPQLFFSFLDSWGEESEDAAFAGPYVAM